MNSPPSQAQTTEQTDYQKLLLFLQTKVYPVPDELILQLEVQGEGVIEVWRDYTETQWKEIAGVARGIPIYNYLNPKVGMSMHCLFLT
jgi:hypothetical protein